MIFLLTITYVMLTFLSPAEVMPALAPFRPMIILSGLGLLAAILTIPLNQLAWRSPQPVLLALFIGMLMASRLLNGWPGGVPLAFMAFMPAAACFYLTIGTIDSLRKIQLTAAGLLVVGLYFNTMGILSFHGYIHDERFLFEQTIRIDPETETAERIIRMKAVGIMDDPNDFAQFLLLLIPLLWLWKGGWLWNFFTIWLPSMYLLYGIYLTRSRGALVGLAVILLLVLRQRLGNVASAFMTFFLVIGMLAVGFTGGRSVSIGSGSDRLSLWSEGIGMFKSSPLWGIGYQGFADHAGLTAHNSLMQCLAETGLLGYFFWLALVIINIFFLNQLLAPDRQPALPPELLKSARAVSLAFYAFLATSWFLSRAYNPALYLFLGLTVVLHRLAFESQPGFVPFVLPHRWAVLVGGTALASIAFFYVVVNLR